MAIAPLKREIGSEFWNVPTKTRNRLFPKDTQWYLSGRSALQTIISDLKGMRSVALPSWCCDCMIKPFVDAGYKIYFYTVVWADGHLVRNIDKECDVLLIIDYFGYSSNKSDVSSYNGIVIRDITHSLFTSVYTDADYYFGSLRKWCGVWTGGFAWTKKGHKLVEKNAEDFGYTELREKAMLQKELYISGYGSAKKTYLKLFEKAEEKLESASIAPAAIRDIALAKTLDKSFIKERRRANAKVLRNELTDMLVFPKMKHNDCPMFVPVYIKNGKRDMLRRHLIENEIYCPIHWPVSAYHKLNKQTKLLYQNELSLVCDQRYDEDDMYKICECVKSYMRYIK